MHVYGFVIHKGLQSVLFVATLVIAGIHSGPMSPDRLLFQSHNLYIETYWYAYVSSPLLSIFQQHWSGW